MRSQLNELFCKAFSSSPHAVYFSPSRVNLIGEHTDYNGGHVLPCALDIGTWAAVSLRDDHEMRCISGNFPEDGILTAGVLPGKQTKKNRWVDYCQGVVWVLLEAGYKIPRGLDIAVLGNVPKGSGLSSSASLEMLIAFLLNDLFDLGIDKLSLIHFCREAESRFVGVNCGIMDMFAIGMGKAGHAIRLHCDTESFKYIPARLPGYVFVIADTRKPRALAGSAYNTRRRECELALMDLNKIISVRNLAEVTPEIFEDVSHVIRNRLLHKRAQHVVTENARTMEAARQLEAGNAAAFGKLMRESHSSLRDDYEVSCRELDVLTEAADEAAGVVGSRLTGAGFGGCAVILVQEAACDEMMKTVGRIYKEKTGLTAGFYPVAISDGPGKVR